MSASSVELTIYNAGLQEMFRAGVALAVAGVAHHAGQPPRNRVRGLQVGLRKDQHNRSIVEDGA
jgi:hypothetical protein